MKTLHRQWFEWSNFCIAYQCPLVNFFGQFLVFVSDVIVVEVFIVLADSVDCKWDLNIEVVSILGPQLKPIYCFNKIIHTKTSFMNNPSTKQEIMHP